MKINKGLNNFLESTNKTTAKKIYNYERQERLKQISDKINGDVKNGRSPDDAANDFKIEYPAFRLIRFNDFFNNFSHFSILD